MCTAALVACSGDAVDETAVEPGDQMLACAIGAGTEFTESCTLQKVGQDGETIYRVNHPGGGFRLFDIAADGSGLVPHDGAEGAVNTLDGDILQVAVGEDRYRFPAQANAE
ncbi:hypothetical protein [Erythrobacter litoralis]|uniref:hypothetical protein n=1 Tax=Erythrobacter litoralis TaxID=39960 RepID=UPI0006741E37|nr:hypothetical protein [Erythrobacter litoralis]